MPFYKKEGESFLSAEIISFPDKTLSIDTKIAYTFPVDGWYWFDTLDAAISFYANQTTVPVINSVQVRLQLNTIGARQAVEAYVAAASQDIKDWWEFSLHFARDNLMLIEAATQIGLTTEQLDLFFVEAAKR